MAYKKYIKRGRKLCGPYYYESYRDSSGKIKKIYVGKTDPNDKTRNFKTLLNLKFLIILLLLILLFGISFVYSESLQSFRSDLLDGSKNSFYNIVGLAILDESSEGISEGTVNEDLDLESFESEVVVEGAVLEIDKLENENEEVFDSLVNESAEEVNETVVELNEGEFLDSQNSSDIYLLNECEILENVTSDILNKTLLEFNETSELIDNISYSNSLINNSNDSVLIDTNVTEFFLNDTLQYRAVIGRPVKWVKYVNLSKDNIKRIKLPKGARNITLKTGREALDTVKEVKDYDELIDNAQPEELKSLKITGNVAFDLKEHEGIFSKVWNFIKRFRFTGNIIVEKDLIGNISEVGDGRVLGLEDFGEEEVAVEYTTPAPQAFEFENSRGKRVVISGPEEVHYTEILAYTQLDNLVRLEDVYRIRLYHVEAKAFSEFEAHDLDLDGNIDYLEWIVPHLSNQTYEIVIIDSEHLDSNRSFVANIYNETFKVDNITYVIPEGEYARAYFEANLTNENFIDVYVVNTTNATIEIYEVNEGEVVGIMENVSHGVYYASVNISGEQDVFDLKSVGGNVTYDFIHDARPAPNTFTSGPTDNGPVNQGTSVTFSATGTSSSSYSYVLTICSASGISCSGASGTCSGGTKFCESSLTSSGVGTSCSHNTAGESGTVNYYAYTCNSNGDSATASANPYSYNILTVPTITLNSPDGILPETNANVEFNCSAVQGGSSLKNVTLYGNWSSGWHANETMSLTGSSNSSVFTKVLVDNYPYEWNCYVCDTGDNCVFADSNKTFVLNTSYVPPVLGIEFVEPTPEDSSAQEETNVEINISITTEDLDELIYNWNGTNISVLDENLVFAYNFENLSSLGEDSNTIKDITGNGNNAEFYIKADNSSWTSSGKHGGGWSFGDSSATENTADFIMTDGSLVNTDQGSVEFWFKPSYSNSVGDGKSKIFIDTEGSVMEVMFSSSDFFQIYFDGAYRSTGYSAISFNANEWHHLVATYNRTNNLMQIYLDGEAKSMSGPSSSSWGSNTPSGGFFIGARRSNSTSCWSTMDEVKYFNKTLSSEDVRYLYMMNLKKYDIDKYSLYINQTNNSTSGLEEGTYTYSSYVTDYLGQSNSTSEREITIGLLPPVIESTSISPDFVLNGSKVDVNATITDADGSIDTAIAIFYYPNGTFWKNVTMDNISSEYNVSSFVSFYPHGSYNATIWANDTSGESSSFFAGNFSPYLILSDLSSITIDGIFSDWENIENVSDIIGDAGSAQGATVVNVSGGGFVSTSSGCGYPWGIGIDSTDGTLWISDYADDYVYHFNSTGSDLGDGFTTTPEMSNTRGLTFDSSDNTLWVTDTSDDVMYHYGRDGTKLGDDINLATVGATAAEGVVYDESDDTFWVTCSSSFFVYHIDSSGTNLTDGFSVPTEIEDVKGIAIDPRDDTFWMMDDFTDYVFHINATGHILTGGFYMPESDLYNDIWFDNNTESFWTSGSAWDRIKNFEVIYSSGGGSDYDIKTVSLANDINYLYFLINVNGSIMNYTDNFYRIYLDVNPSTGNSTSPEGSVLAISYDYRIEINGSRCYVYNSTFGATNISGCSYANNSDTLEVSVPLSIIGGESGEKINVSFETSSTSNYDFAPDIASFLEYEYSIVQSYAISLSSKLSQQLNWSIPSLPVYNSSAEGNNGEEVSEFFINVSTEGGLIDIYIRANDLMTDALDVLGVGNETYSYNKTNSSVPSDSKFSLTNSYSDNKIGEGLGDGDVVYLKFFLNAMSGQAAGIYNNTLDFKAVSLGESP